MAGRPSVGPMRAAPARLKASSNPQRTGPRLRGDSTAWILFILACAERIAFLIGSRDRGWPFPIFYEGDAEAFHSYAQAILSGAPYDNGIPFHPPGFPLVLAGLYALMGDPIRHGIVRAILGIASAALPPMLYLLVRDRFGRGAALAAGLLAAFSFGLDVTGVSATSEGLYLLLGMGLLLAARGSPGGLRVDARGDPHGPALAGAAPRTSHGGGRAHPGLGRAEIARAGMLGIGAGVLALIRAEGTLLGLSIAVVWIVPLLRVDRRRGAILAAVTAAGLAVALTPWTIRNAVRLSEWNEQAGRAIGARLPTFVPLTAYGPLNFALANNDDATGGFQRKLLTSRQEVAVLDLGDPQHRFYFIHGTGEGLRWIAAHPGRFASLAVRKLGITIRALDLGWLPWNVPSGRAGTRLPVDIFYPDAGGLRWAQLLLAGAGVFLLFRRGGSGRVPILLALPILTAFLATLLFFGYVRLGVTMTPSIFAFEGVAIAAAAERLPARLQGLLRSRTLRRALVAIAFVTLVIAAVQNRDYRASGSTDRPGGMLQRDAPIRIEPLRR